MTIRIQSANFTLVLREYLPPVEKREDTQLTIEGCMLNNTRDWFERMDAQGELSDVKLMWPPLTSPLPNVS